MGTIEITRLGMHEAEMETIADFIARVLIEGTEPEAMRDEVIAFRASYQTLYYCFDNGLPGQA
jgi:glycine hydroxymethyltransferase